MRRSAFLGAGVGVAAVFWIDCLGPTEIELVLSTDVKCAGLRGTAVVVGQLGEIETAPPTTTSTFCTDSGDLGMLVVVPSGGRTDQVAVKITAGLDRDATACTAPDYAGCIVARRALHYVPHTPLRVLVPLRGDCGGIPCGATETCSNGACTSASIDPTTCEGTQGCAEPDGGPAPLDAGSGDAGVDAGITSRAITCGDMSGLQAGAPWPMVGYCPTHQGRSPFVGPQTPNLLWKGAASNAVSAAATVAADGTVYVGSNDRQLHAFFPDGGARWQFQTGNNINHPAPAIAADGTLTFATSDTNIYHVASDGGFLWKFPTGSDMISSAAIGGDGTIFIGGGYYGATSDAGRSLLALNPADGGQVFAVPTSDAVVCSPAIGVDGTVYFSGADSTLYAVDRTGATKWTLPIQGDAEMPVIADDGTIYVSAGASLTAVSPAGTLNWSRVYKTPTGAALGADGTIYLNVVDIGDAGTAAAFLVAVTPDGLTEKWRTQVGNRVDYPPAVGADGTIYVPSFDANVYAIAPDGTQKWTFLTGGALNSGIALADHVLYIGSSDNFLYAIGP